MIGMMGSKGKVRSNGRQRDIGKWQYCENNKSYMSYNITNDIQHNGSSVEDEEKEEKKNWQQQKFVLDLNFDSSREGFFVSITIRYGNIDKTIDLIFFYRHSSRFSIMLTFSDFLDAELYVQIFLLKLTELYVLFR